MSEAIPAKKPVVHRSAANPTKHNEWKAAAKERSGFRTSGDSGFYDVGANTAMFVVEVDGKAIGRFTKVDGLEVTVEVVPVKEGGQNGFEHKLPGRMSWPNLKLTRGVTETDGLLAWVKQSSGEGFAATSVPGSSPPVTKTANKLVRSTLSVVLVAGTKRLREWSFEGAFPVRWSGPSLAMDRDGLPEEELEIAHHGFKTVTT